MPVVWPEANFIAGFFGKGLDKLGGYAVEDCLNACARTCLEFLIPIVNPEKPHQMTVRLAIIVLRAWSKNRDVEWGIIIRDLAQK
jgi:hypothetical protein